MTERLESQVRRTKMSLLTKRLMAMIAMVAAMAIGLSVGFLAARLFVS
jgi:hypothetical protein